MTSLIPPTSNFNTDKESLMASLLDAFNKYPRTSVDLTYFCQIPELLWPKNKQKQAQKQGKLFNAPRLFHLIQSAFFKDLRVVSETVYLLFFFYHTIFFLWLFFVTHYCDNPGYTIMLNAGAGLHKFSSPKSQSVAKMFSAIRALS